MNEQQQSDDYILFTDKRYHAWLLRVWQEHDAAPWRFQLKDVAGNKQHLFETLPALMDFLAERVSESECPN